MALYGLDPAAGLLRFVGRRVDAVTGPAGALLDMADRDFGAARVRGTALAAMLFKQEEVW